MQDPDDHFVGLTDKRLGYIPELNKRQSTIVTNTPNPNEDKFFKESSENVYSIYCRENQQVLDEQCQISEKPSTDFDLNEGKETYKYRSDTYSKNKRSKSRKINKLAKKARRK